MKALRKFLRDLFTIDPPPKPEYPWNRFAEECSKTIEEMRDQRISSPKAVGALRRGIDYGQPDPELEDAVEAILREKGVVHGYQG